MIDKTKAIFAIDFEFENGMKGVSLLPIRHSWDYEPDYAALTDQFKRTVKATCQAEPDATGDLFLTAEGFELVDWQEEIETLDVIAATLADEYESESRLAALIEYYFGLLGGRSVKEFKTNYLDKLDEDDARNPPYVLLRDSFCLLEYDVKDVEDLANWKIEEFKQSRNVAGVEMFEKCVDKEKFGKRVQEELGGVFTKAGFLYSYRHNFLEASTKRQTQSN